MALGGDLVVRLDMDSRRFSRGLSKARSRLSGFVSAAGRAVVGLGAIAASALIPALKIASDLEETMNKFNVVFGENSRRVKEWGDTFAGTVGRSQEQIARFLAGSQDLFVPLGFEPGAAEAMSKQITSLAVDLASFNNMADDDTLRDLQAALTGSSEVMKKYGVIVNETAVKQRALQMGWNPKELTEQQKVLARLNIIMEGTTAAQGDAIRSAGSFANQMKRLKAQFMDSAASLGQVFLPIATKGLTILTEAIQFTVFAVQNFGLTWDVMKETAGNALTSVVSRVEWFGGAVVDVVSFIWRNWREIFTDMANLAMTVLQNMIKNLQSASKSFAKSAAKGFRSFSAPKLVGLTEGFKSSIDEALEIREFKPPKLKTAAAEKFGQEFVKQMGLGEKMAELTGIDFMALGGEGSTSVDEQAEKKKEFKPQGPVEAISAFSKEGFDKIITAMTGGKRPEDKTAKNTESMDKTLKDMNRKMDEGGSFQVAGATV